MGFVRDVANPVIFMDGGKIIEENNAHDFFSRPREERTKQFLARILSAATYSVEYMIWRIGLSGQKINSPSVKARGIFL